MSQVYIQKGNKQLRIDENDLSRYLARGFCTVDKDGKITQEATSGKTITIEQHNAAIAKLDKIIEEKDAEITKLKGKANKTDSVTDKAAEKTDEKTPDKTAERTVKQ